jgi:hypothetical protein
MVRHKFYDIFAPALSRSLIYNNLTFYYNQLYSEKLIKSYTMLLTNNIFHIIYLIVMDNQNINKYI